MRRLLPLRLPQIKYRNKIYTVDHRLNEIRYIVYGKLPEFYQINSIIGQEIIENGKLLKNKYVKHIRYIIETI